MKKVKPLPELEKMVDEKIEELNKIVDAKYGKYTHPEVMVNYDLKSSKALGTHTVAFVGDGYYHYISLNVTLLNTLKEVYINEVLVHEYAHACVDNYCKPSLKDLMKGKKEPASHGKEFKMFCSLFGISGAATTKIAMGVEWKTKTKPTPWTYSCGCSDHQVSNIIHNRIQSNQGSYSCRKCKQQLVYKQLVKC